MGSSPFLKKIYEINSIETKSARNAPEAERYSIGEKIIPQRPADANSAKQKIKVD